MTRERLQRGQREAESRTAKPARPYARGIADRIACGDDLRLDLFATIVLQPRFVMERVIPDFVAGLRDGAQRRLIFLQSRILADDEDRDPLTQSRKNVEESRHDDVEVRRKRFPGRIAVRLDIGPLVVEIERKAGDRFHRAASAASASIAARPRSTSATVSLTLSVPFTMCAELSKYTPGRLVAIGGSMRE